MSTREIQNFVGLVTFIPQYCAYFNMHCGYKLVFLMLKAFNGIDPELFFFQEASIGVMLQGTYLGNCCSKFCLPYFAYLKIV